MDGELLNIRFNFNMDQVKIGDLARLASGGHIADTPEELRAYHDSQGDYISPRDYIGIVKYRATEQVLTAMAMIYDE